jgi:hypothetical protein
MYWILIFIISTSSSSQSGAAGITVEFKSEAKCMAAAKALVDRANRQNDHVLSVLCSEK